MKHVCTSLVYDTFVCLEKDEDAKVLSGDRDRASYGNWLVNDC